MKKILLTIAVSLLMMSCSAQKHVATLPQKQMTVRVTTYWKNGTGSDRWTRNGISCSGAPLINKTSAAVDPKLIPFGKRIEIPELKLNLVAVDTGSAVKKRTASLKNKRSEPVIDLFFEDKRDALNFCRRNKRNLVTDAFIY